MRIIVIHTDLQKQTAKKAIDELPLGARFEVRIQKHTKKRSTDQNSLFHKWMQILAEHTGYTAKEMKDIVVMECLGTRPVSYGGKTVEVLLETSNLNTMEFSQMMDQVYRWALNDLDCLLPLPEDEFNEQLSREGR